MDALSNDVAELSPRPRRSGPLLAVVDRYNRGIGTLTQKIVAHLLVVYVAGPILWLLLRLAFRVRVENAGHLDTIGPRAIFAFRHFYEWDPFVTYIGAAWSRSLRRPSLHPHVMAGKYWMRRRWLRATSYAVGIIGLVPGDRTGLARAGSLLASGDAVTIAIAPTGPVGRRRTYEVKPGVGQLMVAVPDVPVVPVSLEGLQDLRFSLATFLRRPPLTIRLGQPFRARDVAGSGEAAVAEICGRIRREWESLEAPRVS